MLKAERKLIDFIEKHIHIFFIAAVFAIGCILRLSGRHFVSHDAGAYLLKWYREIADGAGISRQVGNYNIPYQILIYLMTKLPLNPLTDYKALSCAFDLALAALAGFLVRMLSDSRREMKGALAFALVFCSPIVVLNSAVWAQCDSIYTFFGIAALAFLYREKYVPAFIMLGVSFAFKLQAVFFLPFFLIFYVCRKKFSILYLAFIPAMMILLSLPGLLAGRNIADIVRIYLDQTHVYDRVYVGFPSVYVLLTTGGGAGHYTMFRWISFFLTFLVLGIGLYLCVCRRMRLSDKKVFWGVAIWCIFSSVLFLPNMHERYGYALEILLILYCFVTTSAVPAAIAVNLLPLATYGDYLFGYLSLPMPVLTLINIAAYVLITYLIFFKDPGAHTAQGQERPEPQS